MHTGEKREFKFPRQLYSVERNYPEACKRITNELDNQIIYSFRYDKSAHKHTHTQIVLSIKISVQDNILGIMLDTFQAVTMLCAGLHWNAFQMQFTTRP